MNLKMVIAPTLTTTAIKGDLFVFRYNGSKWLEVGRNQNLTLLPGVICLH